MWQIILAQAPGATPPSNVPTWENLIPWVVAFFAFLTSGIVWYVLKDIKDAIINLRASIDTAAIAQDKRTKGVESAIDRAARSNLMLVISLPQSSPAMKIEANAIGKELDDAAKSREQT